MITHKTSTKKCESCSKEFTPLRRSKGRFCSHGCHHNSFREYPNWGSKAIAMHKLGFGSKRIGAGVGATKMMVLNFLKRTGNHNPHFAKSKENERRIGTHTAKLKIFDVAKVQAEAFNAEQKKILIKDRSHWNNHPAANSFYSSENYRNNPQRVRDYQNARRRTNINHRLTVSLRSRIYRVLKGSLKSAPTLALLGCSVEHLKAHIQSQFAAGMTWENHGVGRGKWNLDHRIPCASFDLSNPEQQRECFHFKNLQPMWAIENIQKSDKLIYVKPQ